MYPLGVSRLDLYIRPVQLIAAAAALQPPVAWYRLRSLIAVPALIVALFVSLSWLGIFRLMPDTARQVVAVLFAIAALAALSLVAMAAALIFLTFMPMSFFGRLVSTFDVEQSSNLDRIRMAEGGIEMIKDYPVMGVGPAYIKEVYPLYRRADAPRFRIPHLHNNVLQLWAERGILGLAAYLVLIGLFLRECIRGWNGPSREFAQAGVAITVGLAVAGLFEFNFGDTEVFFMTLGLMALIVAFLERPDETAPNELRPGVVAAGSEPATSSP